MAIILILAVMGIFSYVFLKDYNSIENRCKRQYKNASDFFQSDNKLQEKSLEQARELAIKECIKEAKNEKQKQKEYTTPPTIPFNVSPTLTDTSREEILEFFRKEQEESQKLKENQEKLNEICDYSPVNTEDYQQNLDIPYESSLESYDNKYISPLGYSIEYPDNWTIAVEKIEDVDTVFLKKEGLEKPHIAIGSYAVYSTSGALCANLYCDYTRHTYEVLLGEEIVPAEVVGMYRLTHTVDEDFTKCKLDINFEGFRVHAKHGEYKLYETDDRYFPLNIFASFTTKKEGREIQKILNTLDFK